MLDGKEVFNLGFGDYDVENDSIIDNVVTNNNDARKVFNTVLSTIPRFFEYYPGKILGVRGSDSRPEFKNICKTTCKRQCGEGCKKFNQRIRIYCNYIDLHFDELNIEYQFFGRYMDVNGVLVTENYNKGRDYYSIYLITRK